MNEEKNREYKDFIEQLISDADLEALKSSALSLYRDGWRHSYATLFPIFTKLYEEQEANDDNDKPLDAILYKLDALQKSIEQDLEEEKAVKSEACQENTEKDTVQTKLEKLKDHIALEINRIRKWGPTHRAYIEMLQDVDQAKEDLEDIKKQQERMETHYITILGIFAAIVIGATSAVSTSSSIFECVVNSSDTKLVIAGLLHVLLCTNILFILVHAVKKDVYDKKDYVNGSKDKSKNSWVYSINILAYIANVAIPFVVTYLSIMSH